MKDTIEIKIAQQANLEGIIKLQSDNQVSQGGTLSGELNKNQIQEMMHDMPQIVALMNDQVVGFLLTTSKAAHHKLTVPIVNAMFESYTGTADSYIYGPICVSKDQRGKGLAQLMFKELIHNEPNREGVLFIRSDNEPSLRAHEKMGMHKVSSFGFNNAKFDVFAY
ncbi:N-acetyltransferase family protein [Flavobacterium sp.]|uniref:GNAT family N-acetyltransferase n=1 Tax=Flavobacterium sp. TaxID=239 RepID=UPI003C4E1148